MGLIPVRLRRAGVLLALLLMTGCSSTTFMYNRLDFFIPWYLGDYVSLNRAQKKSLDELLQPFLSWHRQEELPRYLDLLDGIDAALEDEVTADELGALADDFVVAWERTEARALEWLLALGAELSDAQMEDFIENLRDKQQEYEEEYLPRSAREYHEEAYENLLDSTQDFLGRLDWGQRGILEEAANRLQRSDGIWLEERQQWLRQMEQHLQRQPGWQQGIRDMLATRDETASAEYLAVYEHNSAVIYQALARLLNTRTEKQDRRLRKRLADLREDLESLAVQ